MGYHVPLKDKMVKVYSRDYQAGPLRKLEEVEAKIDSGEFDPDVTRSGRFKTKLHDKAPQVFTYILSMLYKKLHLRNGSSIHSPCGRATAFSPGFEVFATVPPNAKTLCKHCFGDKTLEALKIAS